MNKQTNSKATINLSIFAAIFSLVGGLIACLNFKYYIHVDVAMVTVIIAVLSIILAVLFSKEKPMVLLPLFIISYVISTIAPNFLTEASSTGTGSSYTVLSLVLFAVFVVGTIFALKSNTNWGKILGIVTISILLISLSISLINAGENIGEAAYTLAHNSDLSLYNEIKQAIFDTIAEASAYISLLLLNISLIIYFSKALVNKTPEDSNNQQSAE